MRGFLDARNHTSPKLDFAERVKQNCICSSSWIVYARLVSVFIASAQVDWISISKRPHTHWMFRVVLKWETDNLNYYWNCQGRSFVPGNSFILFVIFYMLQMLSGMFSVCYQITSRTSSIGFGGFWFVRNCIEICCSAFLTAEFPYSLLNLFIATPFISTDFATLYSSCMSNAESFFPWHMGK